MSPDNRKNSCVKKRTIKYFEFLNKTNPLGPVFYHFSPTSMHKLNLAPFVNEIKLYSTQRNLFPDKKKMLDVWKMCDDVYSHATWFFKRKPGDLCFSGSKFKAEATSQGWETEKARNCVSWFDEVDDPLASVVNNAIINKVSSNRLTMTSSSAFDRKYAAGS